MIFPERIFLQIKRLKNLPSANHISVQKRSVSNFEALKVLNFWSVCIKRKWWMFFKALSCNWTTMIKVSTSAASASLEFNEEQNKLQENQMKYVTFLSLLASCSRHEHWSFYSSSSSFFPLSWLGKKGSVFLLRNKHLAEHDQTWQQLASATICGSWQLETAASYREHSRLVKSDKYCCSSL